MRMFIMVLGLLIGSFLNVCICRIPKEEAISLPPSHCVKCNNRLRTFDLIPVFSYIILGGKCRYCGEKISFRYPLVEILTSIAFILLYKKYGIGIEFFLYAFFISILIVIFFIDIDYLIIPDKLVLLGMLSGLILIFYSFTNVVSLYGDREIWSPFLGAIIGAGTLFLIALFGKIIYKCDEVMGMGDVKIFIPIGLFLGWKMTIVALMISFLLGGFIGLLLIVINKEKRKSTMPFGPFIVAACFITILYGWDILDWYIYVVFM